MLLTSITSPGFGTCGVPAAGFGAAAGAVVVAGFGACGEPAMACFGLAGLAVEAAGSGDWGVPVAGFGMFGLIAGVDETDDVGPANGAAALGFGDCDIPASGSIDKPCQRLSYHLAISTSIGVALL